MKKCNYCQIIGCEKGLNKHNFNINSGKCDYCQFGKRAKDGNKVLCEKKGLVDSNYSCGKFEYSPLKRIPVKQLNFVGSLADEDIYIESIGDRAEKEEEEKKTSTNDKNPNNNNNKSSNNKASDNISSTNNVSSEEKTNNDQQASAEQEVAEQTA